MLYTGYYITDKRPGYNIFNAAAYILLSFKLIVEVRVKGGRTFWNHQKIKSRKERCFNGLKKLNPILFDLILT